MRIALHIFLAFHFSYDSVTNDSSQSVCPVDKNTRILFEIKYDYSSIETCSDIKYDDQRQLITNCTKCKGNRQSPINVLQSHATTKGIKKVHLRRNLELKFYIDTYGMTFFQKISEKSFFSFIDAEDNEYRFFEIIVRTSCDNQKNGSEHLVNGVSFDLELQFRFILTSTLAKKFKATKKSEMNTDMDEFAILSFLFKSTEGGPEGIFLYLLKKQVNNLDKLSMSIDQIIPDFATWVTSESAVRYCGSLSYPPCTENIVYYVFTKPLNISKAKLEEYKKKNYKAGVNVKCNNIRKTNQVNNEHCLNTRL